MKKRLMFALALIGLLAACRHPAESRPDAPDKPVDPTGETIIVFDNTQGICAVIVYEDYRRRDEDKVAEIPAGASSPEIAWTASASTPFYFEYRVNLKGISGFTLNYVPQEVGKDQVAVRIDAETKTVVIVPKLEETISPDGLLSNNSYILIQNNSSFSFQFHRGSFPINPDDSPNSVVVNPGERAQYTVNPGSASNYRLLVGADYVQLPGSLASFEAGVVYSFIFNDGVSLIAEVEAKLENVADVTPDKPVPNAPGAPVVGASDSLLTVHWTAVQGADSYEVYLSDTQSPPDQPQKTVPGTTTVFSGLANETVYYVWIKAVNENGASDFSPRARGIPWPAAKAPATPESPVIIPGINQLTANWEESGGASSYEVYISTAPQTPSSATVTTEKTSAVIANLENSVIYYIWVRAVNSAGKSGFSPVETGTPRIPTSAPAVPARPVLVARNKELAVSWQAVELAAAYEAWFGTSGNSAQAQKYNGDISGTETVITGLTNETTYCVWIKSKNVAGTSGFSLPANGTPSAFAVLPETPSVPTVVVGSRELTVSWPLVEGALFYEVWTGATGNSASAAKHGADISGTSITLANLENGITHYIWVRAKNNIGASDFSPVASGTPSASAATPPSPQNAPTVSAGNGQIMVSWLPVEGASSYEVWAGTTPNPTTAAKRGDDVSALSAVISSLTNGTTYYVWVKAKNSVGTSGFSPMASGTPSSFTVIPQSPATPAVNIGNGQITVSWSAVEGALAYEIWQGTSNDSASAVKNGDDENASLSRTISGLNNGTAYYIWLKAKNNVGTSGFSPVASGKPIANAAVPTLAAGNGQLFVTWAVVAGADQYEVFYGTGTNPPQTAAQTTTATSASITGLTNGTSYNVWVRGKNSTGTGAMSAAASAKPVGNMGAVTVASGDGQLTVSWSAVAGADQYEVYCDIGNSIPSTPAQMVSATTATISSLANGTTYNVWVKPKNANGAGEVSAPASGTPMAAPGSLILSVAHQQITVSWAAVPGAASYEVFYSTTTTIPASPSDTVTTLNHTFVSFTNGTTYYLWVKAVNANGTSAASPMASGKPIGNMGAVTLTVGGSGQLVLSWSAVAGADQYEVYHNTTTTMPGTASSTVSATTATISSLVNGTTYNVWVKPKNANGVGAESTAVSGKPIAGMGAVALATGGSGELVLSWSAVTGADEYEVYRNTGNSIPASPVQTVSTTTATISGLVNGTTYYFWVKGKNSSGTSSASTVVSGKPIGSMGAVTLTSGNEQLTVSWSAVAGADQYEVYHSTSTTMPGTASQTVNAPATTATIGTLTNGTTYYVWVKGKNTTGTGNASTVVSGKPLGTHGAPTVSPAYKQLLVTWTAVPGADEYEVYYGTGITPTTLIATTASTTTTIKELTGGVTYYVRLRAKNSTGVSDYGPSGNGVPDIVRSPGLYRGDDKIGDQNLSSSVSYLSTSAVTGGDYYIVLGADESVSPMTLNYTNKTVGITLSGYGSERTVTLGSNGNMFTVNAGVTLTLNENITLVGRDTNNASLVLVNSDGFFIMDDGEITGNTSSSFRSGGGVFVNGGTFVMHGGTIIGNILLNLTNQSGGGGVSVFDNGTFTMNGGTISGNRAHDSGGVYVSNGIFTMNGGEISGNTSDYTGGVSIRFGGTFTMYDGSISGNTASGSNVTGGGVWVGGTFTMYNGSISGNTASGNFNGGSVLVMDGIFTMHGGVISGNTASGDYRNCGGVFVYNSTSTFIKQPGSGSINSGIIYGSDAVGNDVNGIPLKNIGADGHAVYSDLGRRNTTAGQTDQIDTSTGRGLSANGNAPYLP